MERRNFIKGALIAVAAMAPGKILAVQYEHDEGKNIQKLLDREKPSALEQKHVPGIEAPASVIPGSWFDIKVKVGFMGEHPSTPEHWITMIKLLVEGKEIARSSFPVGGAAAPVETFRIKLDKTSQIEAVENCNLHGTWTSEPFKITV
jgi:superoxide reductase